MVKLKAKVKILSIIMLVFIALLCFAGCGKRFNGIYFDSGSDYSAMEFTADGSCLYSYLDGGHCEYYRGKYKWDKNDECYYVTINETTYSVVFHPDYNGNVIIVNGGEYENVTFSKTGNQQDLNGYEMRKQRDGY